MSNFTRTALRFPGRVKSVRMHAFLPAVGESEKKETADRRAAEDAAIRAAERARVDPLARALAEAAQATTASCASMELRAEPLMIELVKRISHEVLRREVEQGRYDLNGIVRDCLQAARGVDRGVTICLNPLDVKECEENGWMRALEGGGAKLKSDATIARGGCRVETPYGAVIRDIPNITADVFAAVDGRR